MILKLNKSEWYALNHTFPITPFMFLHAFEEWEEITSWQVMLCRKFGIENFSQTDFQPNKIIYMRFFCLFRHFLLFTCTQCILIIPTSTSPLELSINFPPQNVPLLTSCPLYTHTYAYAYTYIHICISHWVQLVLPIFTWIHTGMMCGAIHWSMVSLPVATHTPKMILPPPETINCQ